MAKSREEVASFHPAPELLEERLRFHLSGCMRSSVLALEPSELG